MTDTLTGVQILFSGQHAPGSNSFDIARAFEHCGALVRMLDDTAIYPAWHGVPGRALRRLILRPIIEAEWNRQLLKLVEGFKPDLVYITNADLCFPETVLAIRRRSIPVMCFYHDVLWRDRPGSRFSQNIQHFDLVATTRHWQVPEFEAAGARAVKVVRFGCDPDVHRPITPNAKLIERYGADVTFIGTSEPHRAAELTSLISQDFPYSFRLWGSFWDRVPDNSALLRHWQGRPVYEQEISVIYATTKVALHWVGWEPHGPDAAMRQGDQHNSRTFQIAACGGALMMAQRTDEHLALFAEGEEAVYFDDVAGLRALLRDWLRPERDAERRRIAAAARARLLREDYSYTPVVRSFLEHFGLPASPPSLKGRGAGG